MDEVQKRIKFCLNRRSEVLDISFMNLTQLPSNLPDFIKILHCNNNQIIELPETLPSSLVQLYCHNNKIKRIPSYSLSNVKWIYCENNNIKEMPSKLPYSLIGLLCSNNQMEEFSSNLPTTVYYLDISRNLIKKFHLNISPNAPNYLTLIYCNHNQLVELPSNLPLSLKTLRCDNNYLKHLPSLPIQLQNFTCSDNDKYMYISKRNAERFRLIETPNYSKKAIIIQHTWKVYQCKQIMIRMINNNDNVLFHCFKYYGDLNIINLIIQFIY